MIAHITAVKMPTLHRHAEEKFFVSAEGRKEPVPSIHDSPTKELSVVVPSYNEEDRCKICLVLRKKKKVKSVVTVIMQRSLSVGSSL